MASSRDEIRKTLMGKEEQLERIKVFLSSGPDYISARYSNLATEIKETGNSLTKIQELKGKLDVIDSTLRSMLDFERIQKERDQLANQLLGEGATKFKDGAIRLDKITVERYLAEAGTEARVAVRTTTRNVCIETLRSAALALKAASLASNRATLHAAPRATATAAPAKAAATPPTATASR